MRVLEVVATLKRAGAEHVATQLAERLEGAVVSLFDPFPQGLRPDVPVFYLGKRPGLDVRMFPRLKRVLREYRPDVVHTHSYVMRYVLPVARAKLVHTVHNLAEKEVDAVGRMVHRLAWRRGAVPVAVSKEVARSFHDVYGFEPKVIPNGIDTAVYQRAGARERWRTAHGFAERDRIVVSVARLHPQKNPRGLVEAFARVPEAHLVLAGAGSLGIEPPARVHLLGVVEDVPELLAAADAFALASDWEGQPVSILEAMAAGLPVAATAVGGVPEVVEHGVTGLLVPKGDMRAMGDAIAAVLNAPEMGQAGRRRAAGFDVARMVESYAAVFRQ